MENCLPSFVCHFNECDAHNASGSEIVHQFYSIVFIYHSNKKFICSRIAMEFPSEKDETDFLLVILDVLNCLAWRTFLAIRLDKSVLVEAILLLYF